MEIKKRIISLLFASVCLIGFNNACTSNETEEATEEVAEESEDLMMEAAPDSVMAEDSTATTRPEVIN